MDPRFPTPALRRPWALCAIALFCVARPAIAQEATPDGAPPEAAVSAEDQRTAEEHLARGLALYGQKHYTEAVEEFRAGSAVHADPRLLYALAQALRLAGQCTEAVTYYQRFLDQAPGPAQEVAARANLERCREPVSSEPAQNPLDLAPEPPTTRPPPPARTPPSRPVASHPNVPNPGMAAGASGASRRPTPTHDAAHAWYADTLGATLTGGGLLGVGAGVTLMLLANSKRTESERLEHGATQGTYQDHADRLDTGRVELLAGGVSTAVGLAAVALGVLRFHSVASRPTVDVGLSVLPMRATATVGGTF
jgi:hypothetical protein